MTTFTPGPWVMRQIGGRVDIVADRSWVPAIATVYGFSEEAAANARALHALPDLVTALQITRQMISDQIIANAIVDVTSMQSLGQVIDAVLGKAGVS
jgi:hypothetical protein